MRARWAAVYVATLAIWAVCGWWGSLTAVRVCLTLACLLAAGWFLRYREQQKLAQRLEEMRRGQIQQQVMRSSDWLN